MCVMCAHRKEYADVEKRFVLDCSVRIIVMTVVRSVSRDGTRDRRCVLLLAALKGGMRDRLRRAAIDVDARTFGVTVRDCIDTLHEFGLTERPPWDAKQMIEM
jgi:hypothetical protein